MRAFTRLRATATAAGTTKGFKPAPLALLPPIPLYRRLLRAHRKHLQREMRLLGDEYVKAEFRAHREVENPVHIVCLSFRLRFSSYEALETCKRNCADCDTVIDRIFDGMADVRAKS